jgi:hypothetical protein
VIMAGRLGELMATHEATFLAHCSNRPLLNATLWKTRRRAGAMPFRRVLLIETQ